MKTTRFDNQSRCPECGHKLDAATDINENKAPKAGDISLCINCGAVLEFNADFSVKTFTDFALLDDETRQEIALFKKMIRLQRGANDE